MKKTRELNRLLRLTAMTLVIFIFIFIILLIFQQKIGEISKAINSEINTYENYYVLIADESDSILWESVYEGAIETGREEADAYVEFIESGTGVEYSIQDKLRIAIDSQVDGIIISSDYTQETVELIDEALGKGIPVVTVLNDATDSLRNSYIGVNNYSLGEAYGQVVWTYISEEREENGDCVVSILMDASNEDTGKNTTYLGLKEYLDTMVSEAEWPYQITIEAVSMNREETFVAEETIGNLIVDGNSDVMICLNAVDTESAYRMIVDYNLVGSVEIIGYYESEVILEAVEKDIIMSTITISGEDVGRQSVMALYEYQNTGFVNGYFPVEIQIIDLDNVSKYLEKYIEVSEGEDE